MKSQVATDQVSWGASNGLLYQTMIIQICTKTDRQPTLTPYSLGKELVQDKAYKLSTFKYFSQNSPDCSKAEAKFIHSLTDVGLFKVGKKGLNLFNTLV